jgi:translation initiation factor 1 (eIF-1/SUI1)
MSFNNFDHFNDAGSRELKEKIHIRYKSRNTRKSWTLVEGLDEKNANKLSKIWKKNFRVLQML